MPAPGQAPEASQTHSVHKAASGSDASFPHAYRYPRPGLTADCAVLRVDGPRQTDTDGKAVCKLQLLLIQRKKAPFKDMWALPGGFVDEHEAPEAAAARELEEETGIKGVNLLEVGIFGAPHRDPRGHTVTVAYCAVVSPALAETAQAGDDAAATMWASVEGLPELAFDHADIVRAALRRVGRGIAVLDKDVVRPFLDAECRGEYIFELGACALRGCYSAAQAWNAAAPSRTTAEMAVRAAKNLEEAKELVEELGRADGVRAEDIAEREQRIEAIRRRP